MKLEKGITLEKFGKLMKKKFGSIGGELLFKLHEIYINDEKLFEEKIGIIQFKGTKGCFLYQDNTDYSNSFIVFGYKYYDKDKDKISLKGTIMARGITNVYVIGDKFKLMNVLDVNHFSLLNAEQLIKGITSLELITKE